MNINNKNNIYKNFLTIFIFIIILIAIFLIVELCIKYRAKKEPVYYDVLTPLVDDGKNMKYCLNGCVRGMCNKNIKNKNKNKKSCKYNFQCSYCQDKPTRMFYARFNKEKKVVPIYDKSKKLNNKQKSILNKRIDENNSYVKLLNKKIDILNE
jgi:hypothetical protein